MKTLSVFLFWMFCIHFVFGQDINIEKLDQFFDHLENNNLSIGTVAISKKGKPVYFRDFGQKNLASSSNKNIEKRYHIGSITKTMTATMIYQLFEEGKLKPDDKIDKYFPELSNADKITINHLLGHTSGLGSYLVKDDTNFYWIKEPVTEQMIVNEIIRQGTQFEPEEKVSYSNSGYYLLGKILEIEYNEPYNEILSERIGKPLNLSNTLCDLGNDKTVETPYILNSVKEWQEVEDFYFPNAKAAGNVISTPKDMILFIEALFSLKLISAESVVSMKPIEGNVFGKGLMLAPFYEKIFYGHGGNTLGTHCFLMHNEEDKISMAICINGQYFPLNDIMLGVLSIIYNKDYEFPVIPNTYKVAPEMLSQYEGVYKSEEIPVPLKIFTKESALCGELTGQPAFSMDPLLKNKFINMFLRVEIEFNVAEETLLLKQHGQEFLFRKE